MQFPAGNRKRDPGGDQVDAVCLDGHAFSSLRDGHGRMARQKPGHQADVDGIKMLNKDEGHACVGWHCCQERLEGVKAPGGCADAHNWKTAYDMLPWRVSRSVPESAAPSFLTRLFCCVGMQIPSAPG